MAESLRNPDLIIPDIERCTIDRRDDGEQEYPSLQERMTRLKLNWVTYEDVLELAFSQAPVDILHPA
jgi:hypothetical protein